MMHYHLYKKLCVYCKILCRVGPGRSMEYSSRSVVEIRLLVVTSCHATCWLFGIRGNSFDLVSVSSYTNFSCPLFNSFSAKKATEWAMEFEIPFLT